MGSSCFDLIIFFLCAYLTNFSIATTAQPIYTYHFCSGGNYTANSIYQGNLNSLLSSLLLSTRGELQRQIAGSNPNRVYGFFQCRGDVSRVNCDICKDTAIKEVTTSERCPISKEAIVWYVECTLRYSDRSFFGIMQESPSVCMCNTNNVTNPDRFNQILIDLLDDLIIKSVSGSSSSSSISTYFATADKKITSSEKVYGIVDCTVDLDPTTCNRYLRYAITEIPRCCYGKRGGGIVKPSCYFRYEMYPFFNTKENPPLSLTPPSESPSINGNEKKKKKTRVYIIFTIPIVSAALVIAFVFSICFLRRKATREKAHRGIMQTSVVHLEGAAGSSLRYYKQNEAERNGVDVPFVDFKTILTATDNFSNSNKLGQGGFGPVYKGTFKGGQELAVKRLSRGSGQGIEEFRNEVLLIGKLQHRNLVKLLGYCIKEDEKLLLYEYMPNKSLDSFIFDRTLCLLINWEKRIDIILGIARGILYLHQDSRLRIIHRDLKTSNILLDEEMNPKISDFGLARICGGTQTEGNTNRVVGTYGYMAPEYALDGLFSVKSDVYSFGVVLLEIISGKKNSGFHVSGDSLSLIGYAWRLWNENKVVDFIDNLLCQACNVVEVLKCIQVGLLCVQEDANDRPTMPSAVFMLGGEATNISTPKQPAFVFRRYQSTTTTSSSRPESCSKNEITISAEEGR